MSEHLSQSKHYAQQADELLKQISDPGQKAVTLGLLALTHAVLESGHDIDNVRTAVYELGETVGKLEFD